MGVYTVDYPARLIITSDHYSEVDGPTPKKLKAWLSNPDCYEIRLVRVLPGRECIFYIDIKA